MIANLGFHKQIIYFIHEYQPLLYKIKTSTNKKYNKLLVPLFKLCFFFLYIFIHDYPENRNEINSFVKESYLQNF